MKNKMNNFGLLCFLVLVVLGLGCAKTKDIMGDGEEAATQLTTTKDNYYYYKGEKIPLTKNNSKRYILFEASKEETVDLALSAKGIKIQEKAKLLNLAIQKNDNQPEKELKWMILETSINITSITPAILYEAPFFKTEKGDEVGLSHLFYVKLKKLDDYAKLVEAAKKYKVEILGKNDFPGVHRYTLSCTNTSLGNALEMANTFYETGYFASCQADLMVSIVLN